MDKQWTNESNSFVFGQINIRIVSDNKLLMLFAVRRIIAGTVKWVVLTF